MKKKSKLSTCLKALVVTSPLVLLPSLTALEKPAEKAKEQAPKEKVRDARAGAENAPKAIQKAAMLGVGGNSVSKTLSLHLGLEGNTGLTIYHIVPGSAAAKAGIVSHDIITKINDTAIGSQADLRAVVLDHKPGDEITVKLIHKGEAVEKKVTLGERIVAPRGGVRPMQGNLGMGNDLLQMLQGMGGDIPEADRKRVEQEMRKRVDELQRQFQNGGGFQIPRGPKLREGVLQMLGGTNATIKDRDGSVTMKTLNGKTEVIVRDNAGKIVFEGPYETEQDKAAVPDDVADRLKRVDLDMGLKKGGMMGLRINPEVMPLPIPEGEE